MDSILNSIKKLLGIYADYHPFDQDIIMHINSVFFILNQLGVGPREPYNISGEEETWQDFYPDIRLMSLIKSYVYTRVRLMFDPPQSGVLFSAMERQIAEYEFRLNAEVDPASPPDRPFVSAYVEENGDEDYDNR